MTLKIASMLHTFDIFRRQQSYQVWTNLVEVGKGPHRPIQLVEWKLFLLPLSATI